MGPLAPILSSLINVRISALPPLRAADEFPALCGEDADGNRSCSTSDCFTKLYQVENKGDYQLVGGTLFTAARV